MVSPIGFSGGGFQQPARTADASRENNVQNDKAKNRAPKRMYALSNGKATLVWTSPQANNKSETDPAQRSANSTQSIGMQQASFSFNAGSNPMGGLGVQGVEGIGTTAGTSSGIPLTMMGPPPPPPTPVIPDNQSDNEKLVDEQSGEGYAITAKFTDENGRPPMLGESIDLSPESRKRIAFRSARPANQRGFQNPLAPWATQAGAEQQRHPLAAGAPSSMMQGSSALGGSGMFGLGGGFMA